MGDLRMTELNSKLMRLNSKIEKIENLEDDDPDKAEYEDLYADKVKSEEEIIKSQKNKGDHEEIDARCDNAKVASKKAENEAKLESINAEIEDFEKTKAEIDEDFKKIELNKKELNETVKELN